MDAGRPKSSQPPDGQAQPQQQTVHVGAIAHVSRLQAKAPALLLLEGGFHPYAPTRATQGVPSGPFIADHPQRDLLADLPGGRQPPLTLVRFPQPPPPLPGLPWLREQGRERLPDRLALRIQLGGVRALVQFDAQEGMPARLLTQLHQLLTTDATLGSQAALGLAQMRADGGHKVG